MKRNLIAVFAVAVLLVSSTSFSPMSPTKAQDKPTQAQQEAPDARMCNEIFSQGIRDNYQLLTDRQVFHLYQQRFCQTRFSSYQQFRETAGSLGFSIPVFETILNLTGSAEQRAAVFQQHYEQFCSATFDTYQYRDIFQLNIQKVSEDLTKAWEACIRAHLDAWVEANRLGIFVRIVPQGDYRDFTVTVKRRSNRATPTVITGVFPTGRVFCDDARGRPIIPDDPNAPPYQVALNEFAFNCRKAADDEIGFFISTDEGNSNIVMVPRETPKVIELQDNVLRLQGEIVRLQEEVQRALDEMRSALRDSAKWVSLPMASFVLLPKDQTRLLTIDLPASVPSDAREVLLFVSSWSASASPTGLTSRTYEIYTQEGGRRYSQYFAWYRGGDLTTHSNNIWLPITSDRRIYVTWEDAGTLDPQYLDRANNLLFIIGYR